jgi:hypothetical protein
VTPMSTYWHDWSIDGNRFCDLETSAGRIVFRLQQDWLGAWNVLDWRAGSIHSKRIDTYACLAQAKVQVESLWEVKP